MRRLALSPYTLLTLAALFWAASAVVARAVVGEVPPMALNFWRWVLAFVCIAPFGLRAAQSCLPAIRQNLGMLSLLAVLNMLIFGSFHFLGLQYTEAINGALLQGTMTVNILLASWIVLRTRIGPRQTFGVVACFAGLAAIVSRGDVEVIGALRFNVGDLLVFAGVFAYGFYSVYVPRVSKHIDLIPLMTVLVALGAAFSFPFYLLETFAFDRTPPISMASFWSIAYLGIFPSLLAQLFWVSAVVRVGADRASYFIYLSPVFGVLLAMVFLGEVFHWFHGLGIVLIFAGIWFATSRRPE